MDEGTAFRRLVVALGASRESLAALGTWFDLAARLRAEMAGLFVEDADLARMAALPFTRVVGFGSVARDFDPPTWERLLRGLEEEARRSLDELARRRALPCSFRAVRGAAATALLENVGRGDLVVLEHAVFGRAAVQALEVLEACEASVLYLRPEARTGREVFVEAGDGAGPLATAAHLAAASGRGLAVIVRGADGERERAAVASVRRLAPPDVPVRAVTVGQHVRLAASLREERGAILVSFADALERPASGADEQACSLLVVRPARAAGAAARKDGPARPDAPTSTA